MKKNSQGKFVAFIIGVFLLSVLAGILFLRRRPEKYREVRILMGTVVSVDVCTDGRDRDEIRAAYSEVWKRLEDISCRMSAFDENSDVGKINDSELCPVEIGSDTYFLLEKSIYYSSLTGGVFDITVKPLIQLWKECEKKNSIPELPELKKIKNIVGIKNIQLLPNNMVQCLVSGVKIDLGAIAKGYAVDEAARIFREHGIANFFIDAGGDIYAGGLNCRGEFWRVGIRDPRNKFEIMDAIALTDAAVTTSGDYEQYYEIDGIRWPHIINPLTGYPEKEVISATVIAAAAVDADALSTALCVLEASDGINLIDSLGAEYGGLIVIKQNDGGIIKSLSREYKNFQLKKE